MAVNNSLVAKKPTMAAFLTQDAVKNQINSIVGGKDGAKFITSVVSAVQTTPALQECQNNTILSAALLGHSLNLAPSAQLGQFYMVPYDDRKAGVKKAQFQLGYKGYIQLAIRSGYYKKLNVIAIKEGELVKFDPLNEEIEVNLIDDEDAREDAKTIGYYAMFEYTNGFRKAIYWSKKKMLNHADRYSMAFKKDIYLKLEAGEKVADAWKYSSPWYKSFDDMAYKTLIRQIISKWGIMSIDMQTAMTNDMAVINDDLTPDYVDSVDSTDENATAVPNSDVTEQTEETVTNDKTEPEKATDAATALFGTKEK